MWRGIKDFSFRRSAKTVSTARQAAGAFDREPVISDLVLLSYHYSRQHRLWRFDSPITDADGKPHGAIDDFFSGKGERLDAQLLVLASTAEWRVSKFMLDHHFDSNKPRFDGDDKHSIDSRRFPVPASTVAALDTTGKMYHALRFSENEVTLETVATSPQLLTELRALLAIFKAAGAECVSVASEGGISKVSNKLARSRVLAAARVEARIKQLLPATEDFVGDDSASDVHSIGATGDAFFCPSAASVADDAKADEEAATPWRPHPFVQPMLRASDAAVLRRFDLTSFVSRPSLRRMSLFDDSAFSQREFMEMLEAKEVQTEKEEEEEDELLDFLEFRNRAAEEDEI